MLFRSFALDTVIILLQTKLRLKPNKTNTISNSESCPTLWNTEDVTNMETRLSVLSAWRALKMETCVGNFARANIRSISNAWISG